jgi:hypothetical protein
MKAAAFIDRPDDTHVVRGPALDPCGNSPTESARMIVGLHSNRDGLEGT